MFRLTAFRPGFGMLLMTPASPSSIVSFLSARSLWKGTHAQFRKISQVVLNATRRSETRKGAASSRAALLNVPFNHSSHHSFSQASPLLTQHVSHRWRQESLGQEISKKSKSSVRVIKRDGGVTPVLFVDLG